MATTQKIMKKQIVFAALVTFIIAAAAIYGCKKENIVPSENSPLTLCSTDRLLSVANVYLTDDADKAEVWFYETPVIFDFSVRTTIGKNNYEMLKYACEKNLPVNIRTVAHVENMVDRVFAPTSKQLADFKAEMSKREIAANTKVAPVNFIPDTIILGKIFDSVRKRCCDIFTSTIFCQCIPFNYGGNGCWARAHKTSQIIENPPFEYTSYKLFNHACDKSGTLCAVLGIWSASCCQRWWYHVASLVYVQIGDSYYEYVIDPSLFKSAVRKQVWLDAQKNTTTCDYNGSAQYQQIYPSSAYNIHKLYDDCSISVYNLYGYVAANITCAYYSLFPSGCNK